MNRHRAGDECYEDKEKRFGAPLRPVKREGEKISRKASCPCGSGKKYKRCHGN